MAVKKKTSVKKSAAKPKAKPYVKAKPAVKKPKVAKAARTKSKSAVKAQPKKKPVTKSTTKPIIKPKAKAPVKAKAMKKVPVKAVSKTKVQKVEAPRIVNKISPPNSARKSSRSTRVIHQYNYMKAPGIQHDFQVGDRVEVFCDHEKGRERVRGWIAGIVVQVDNKMVAVQFRSNVYLTDGWMVPDRILWYSLTSEHIRAEGGKKTPPKKVESVIPDY